MSIKPYDRNVSRELIDAIATIEADRDALVMALQGMVDCTFVECKERVFAVKLLERITKGEMK